MSKEQSLTSLLEEYAGTEARALELAQQLKPYEDRLKQIRETVLARLEESGKRQFKAAGMIAVVEDKAGSVSWMQEFLRKHGPEEVAALKAAAGTKPALKITKA